jgi:hypothetical protein
MQKYNKAIVALAGAIVGFAVVAAKEIFELDLSGHAATLTDLVVGGLTALCVYLVPNKENV